MEPTESSDLFIPRINRIARIYGFTVPEIFEAMGITDKGPLFSCVYLKITRHEDCDHQEAMKRTFNEVEGIKAQTRSIQRSKVGKWRDNAKRRKACRETKA